MLTNLRRLDFSPVHSLDFRLAEIGRGGSRLTLAQHHRLPASDALMIAEIFAPMAERIEFACFRKSELAEDVLRQLLRQWPNVARVDLGFVQTVRTRLVGDLAALPLVALDLRGAHGAG